MISRTLGPEFGGFVGILFYCAYCVNIAFCCSGCAEEIIKTWYNGSSINDNINDYFSNLIFASVILSICGFIALLGANYFAKINLFLFMIIFTAITLSVLAGFTRNDFVLPDYQHDDQQQYMHQQWNVSQLKDNFINKGPV